MLFAADYPHDYPEAEANVVASRHQLRIVEVPVAMRERAAAVRRSRLLRSLYYMIKVTARALHQPFPPLSARRGGTMTPIRVSMFAAIAAILLLAVIFELIRSRRLQERYALLWVMTGLVLLVLALWRDGLTCSRGRLESRIRRRRSSSSRLSSFSSSSCTIRRSSPSLRNGTSCSPSGLRSSSRSSRKASLGARTRHSPGSRHS